jgi:hypothetical protein
VAPETMARITQPLIETHFFTTMGNLFWKSCIAEELTPKSFRDQKRIPRPDSLETFMIIMPYGINAQAVQDRPVALQFRFTGEIEDACYFLIEDGAIGAKQGISSGADVVIDTPFETWMDILTRKADGQQLFMEQKYRVSGDIDLMIRLFAKN